MGPLEQMKPWSMKGVEGVARFLARVWRLIMEENQAGEWILSGDGAGRRVRQIASEGRARHDQESHGRHRDAFIQHRDFADDDFRERVHQRAEANPLAAMRTLLVLLNPFAPHLTSELWETLGISFQDVRGDITEQPWPDL